MAEYGCSRMTVNKALHSLVEAGLIERRRRAGSFVRRPNIQSEVLAIPDIPAEIVARGQEYRYELMHAHRRRASKADRQIMGVPAGAGVLVLRCRHFAGRRPFALEDRRIIVDEVPDIAEADFHAPAVGCCVTSPGMSPNIRLRRCRPTPRSRRCWRWLWARRAW